MQLPTRHISRSRKLPCFRAWSKSACKTLYTTLARAFFVTFDDVGCDYDDNAITWDDAQGSLPFSFSFGVGV